jgi:hypothetical protein
MCCELDCIGIIVLPFENVMCSEAVFVSTLKTNSTIPSECVSSVEKPVAFPAVIY